MTDGKIGLPSNAVDDRVARLERKLRELQLACGALTVLLILFVLAFMGGNTGGSAQRTFKVLEAERLILRDAKGAVAGTLAVTDRGPALQLFDSKGKLRINTAIFDGNPNITLGDENEVGRAILALVPTGPGLMLYDDSYAPRAQLDVGKEGPRLFMNDQNGFQTTVGTFISTDPEVNKKLGCCSLVLSHERLGMIWHAPDTADMNALFRRIYGRR